MANYSIYTKLSRSNGTIVESTRTFENPPLVIEYDSAVAANQTDLNIEPFAVDVSDLKLFAVVSDQNVTIETNSSSAPTDSIAVVAGVPIIWDSQSGIDCPLTADVTTIYVTNTTAITRLYIIAVMEAA